MSNLLNDVTVFDFETSGLYPMQDRVIEMAAVRVRNGEIVGTYNTIIHQPIELSDKITELTGITPELMRSGMDEETAFKMLWRFMIDDPILVAHNAAFDLAFLHHTMIRLAGKSFNNPFIDTCTIARERHFYPHKLVNMCERYEIKLDGAHRALNDVIGTWELLKAMHQESPVDDYVNRIAYVRKYGPPAWVPEYATVAPIDLKFEPRKTEVV